MLIKDDLFATSLVPASFDLVQARFALTPLGRVEEQLAYYLRLPVPVASWCWRTPTGGAGI